MTSSPITHSVSAWPDPSRRFSRGNVTQQQIAFTLLELLVVVAIIGVLAGLLFPVVNRVMQMGKVTQTSNSLKSIAAGVFAYASDNNGQVPLLYTPTGNWNPPYWCSPERVGKYLVKPIEFGGIKDRTDMQAGTSQSPTLLSPLLNKTQHSGLSDFGGNTEFFLAAWGMPTVEPRYLSSVPNPSKLAMVMTCVETPNSDGSVKTAGWYMAAWGAYNKQTGCVPSDFGSGRIIFAHADGHVSEMPTEDYKKLTASGATKEQKQQLAELLLVDPDHHPPPYGYDRTGELGY